MTKKLDMPKTNGGPCKICGYSWWTDEEGEEEDLCYSCQGIEKMAECHHIIKRMGYTRIYCIESQEEADFYGVEEPGIYASNGSLPFDKDSYISNLLNREPQVLAITKESEALAKHRASGSSGKIIFPSGHGALRELRILKEAGYFNPELRTKANFNN